MNRRRHADADDAPDANEVYRRVLSAQPDKSVVICSVGFITNLRRLLETKPDDISPLDGKALVAKKVARWVAMACQYPFGKEYNSMWDAESSRIAFENGSTLASFARLNGGNVDKIVIGRKLRVMDHPRFSLVIHRRTRTADLSLNGKFFKRYDVQGEVRGKEGTYELPQSPRAFWRTLGVEFKVADRNEIELLMPAKAIVLVAEL